MNDDDIHCLLDSIYRLHQRVAFRDFPRHAIDVTSRLFDNDVCSYGEVDTLRNHAATSSNHPESVARPLVDIWARHTLAPELVYYWRQFATNQVLQLADRMGDDVIERLPIYQEYFKQFGVFHQIILPFVCASGLVISLGFSRRRQKGAFGPRERRLLECIGPHVAQAYESAHALELARRRQSRIDCSLELSEAGLIAITHEGGVEATTANARRWVLEFFHSFPTYTRQLPPELCTWLREQLQREQTGRARRELGRRSAHARLKVRLLGFRERQDLLLVLTRQSPIDTDVLRQALDVTPSQAEVYRLMARGLSNSAITQGLNQRPHAPPVVGRTVEKHVSNLLQCLDAKNRASAINIGLDRLNTWFEERLDAPNFMS